MFNPLSCLAVKGVPMSSLNLKKFKNGPCIGNLSVTKPLHENGQETLSVKNRNRPGTFYLSQKKQSLKMWSRKPFNIFERRKY